MYDCGTGHVSSHYREVTHAKDPEVMAARKELESVLAQNPWPDLHDPIVMQELKRYDKMPYQHYLDNGKAAKRLPASGRAGN